MINNRLGGGTVYVASGVKEEDISAQIDHGRESTYKAGNNLRTSSVMDQEEGLEEVWNQTQSTKRAMMQNLMTV